MKPTFLSIANQEILKAMSPAELQPFLQNWLFFGLLHEVLGKLYCYEDYLVTSFDGEIEKTSITTANLFSRLERWEVEITQDKSSLSDVYEHFAACINLAYACLLVQNPAFDHDLKFHLTSVIEVLHYAVSKACNVAWIDNNRPTLIPKPWDNIIGEDFRRIVLLERSSCCPSQMQILLKYFESPQALSFVAACFDEDQCESHHACDRYTCRAGTSMAANHMPRHVNDYCECQFLLIDEARLVECLEKGSLPLLRIKEEAVTGEMSVEVVASSGSTSYIALSHVSADGLGNSEATALPHCQLSRLKTWIDALDPECGDGINLSGRSEGKPELLLWCDSLCCPVSSLAGKNMALRQMYRTYDEAAAVLVLDRSLISYRTVGMSADEACVRIATSRWMTRLWTLQEGALSSRKHKLWFQFRKTALPARNLYGHIWKVSDTDIRRRGIANSVIKRFHEVFRLFDIDKIHNIHNRTAQLDEVRRALRYRSVTVPSDEPLIVATLLALDLGRILAFDPPERMSALWRLIGTSPSGVDRHFLFREGPRLHQRGLRWAPQSLLAPDPLPFLSVPGDKDNPGFLDDYHNPKGLVVELSGFRLRIAEPGKGVPGHFAGFNSLSQDDMNGHSLNLRGGQGRWYYFYSDLPVTRKLTHAVLSGLTNPWILYRGSSSPTPERECLHVGVLVEEADEQQPLSNELLYVAMQSHVGYCYMDQVFGQMKEAAYCLAQQLASSAAVRHLEELATALTNLDCPSYREALRSVASEIERLARSPLAVEALTVSGVGTDERCTRIIENNIQDFYRGLYVQVEDYAPCTRKWCVD